MALTNNIGADGRTQDLPAPCMRASFRPQTIILDDNEVFYLDTNGAYTDSIPRVLMITACNTTAGADAVAEYQTAFVHIFQEHILVTPLTLLDAASFNAAAQLISENSGAGNEATGTAADLTVGYDSTSENYFLRNDVADNLVVTITRIDGFTQDLVAETA